MNASAFLITTGRGSLAEGRKGGGSLFARTFTIEGRCERLDDFARVGYEKVLPALRRLDGFEGLLVLANHENGKVLVVTMWESEEALRGGEEASHWFRLFGAEAAGGEVTDVERYEVVYSETGGSRH
jgi:heme-degrading monooxygenase HmoA